MRLSLVLALLVLSAAPTIAGNDKKKTRPSSSAAPTFVVMDSSPTPRTVGATVDSNQILLEVPGAQPLLLPVNQHGFAERPQEWYYATPDCSGEKHMPRRVSGESLLAVSPAVVGTTAYAPTANVLGTVASLGLQSRTWAGSTTCYGTDSPFGPVPTVEIVEMQTLDLAALGYVPPFRIEFR